MAESAEYRQRNAATMSKSQSERAAQGGGVSRTKWQFDKAPDIEDWSDFLTEREMGRINRENAENGWGYTRADTVGYIKKFLSGGTKAKAKVQYRFEDVNYHGLNRALDSGDARKVQEWLNRTYDETQPDDSEKKLFKKFGL